MKIGLVGIGLMGGPMGENWLKKGFNLTILPHRRKEVAAALEKAGATVASSLEDLVQKSDCIVLMLPTSLEVESVCDRLAGLLVPRQMVIDMSTSEPKSTVKIHEKFQEKKLRFFDAPVTGGVKGATEGTLTLFIGGPLPWIEEAKPALEAVSRKQIYFGDVGQGHVAKIINNFVCIGNMAVLAEALPLASKLGLNSSKIFDALSDGMAASRQLDFYGPQILLGDFAPRFRLSHAYKDMRLAAQVVQDLKASMPVLDGIIKDFEAAASQGLGEENVSALFRPFEKSLGAEFRKNSHFR